MCIADEGNSAEVDEGGRSFWDTFGYHLCWVAVLGEGTAASHRSATVRVDVFALWLWNTHHNSFKFWPRPRALRSIFNYRFFYVPHLFLAQRPIHHSPSNSFPKTPKSASKQPILLVIDFSQIRPSRVSSNISPIFFSKSHQKKLATAQSEKENGFHYFIILFSN